MMISTMFGICCVLDLFGCFCVDLIMFVGHLGVVVFKGTVGPRCVWFIYYNHFDFDV